LLPFFEGWGLASHVPGFGKRALVELAEPLSSEHVTLEFFFL